MQAKHKRIWPAFLIAVFLAGPTSASEPFSKGSFRGTAILGSGSSFDDDYIILGVGAGYYVIDGLELGLNVQTWLGGDPDITQVTPEITYVFRTGGRIFPYAGALYRRSFISDRKDLDAYGGRGGVNIASGDRAWIGVGGVYLKYRDCNDTLFDCDSAYPEVTFGISF